ncbi:hypothetical protein [Leadbettera azotonutricia]|uniref:Putative membrane protein n=1 Tax=Leadbettera azotonutricia (strain ATCC BAA-888 / DSM 13862 / ZAS-9) TaxID=545695 RepID=F5Y9H5_LEAAZ|nr:hypothetical protein [Leadbettera azotonutricia]AEF82062.1 putative membrane protein [Leadbettera azotonutricia ZAS-9]
MRFSSEDSAPAVPVLAEPVAEKPFYAVLAVYIPLSAMLCLLPLTGRIIGALYMMAVSGESPDVRLPYGIWYLAALLSGLAASGYSALMKRAKGDHGASDFRGGVIVLILAYALGSILYFNRPFGMRFFPSTANVPASFVSLVSWFMVLSIKKVFAERGLFESHAAKYHGEKLRALMLEDSVLLSDADKSLGKLMVFYGTTLVFTLLLGFACAGLGARLPLSLLAALILLFIAGICLQGFFGILRREYAFATEGIVLPSEDRARSLPAIGFFALVAAGLGILLSSDTSLLPPGILAAFFRWFFSLIARLFKPAPPGEYLPPMAEFMPEMPGLPPEFLEAAAQKEPWPFWDYVKYGLIALAAFLFLWFMVYPLLSRPRSSLGGVSLLEKFRRFLVRWFANFGKGLAFFFASIRGGGVKMGKASESEIRRFADDFLAGYSPAKRREMRRSVTLFARLILWGSETLKVSWKASYAPGEFCTLLAGKSSAANPGEMNSAEKGSAIIRCGELFEKALYAAAPLSADEQEEFKGLVEGITRTPSPL